jgi:hypothetical protein
MRINKQAVVLLSASRELKLASNETNRSVSEVTNAMEQVLPNRLHYWLLMLQNPKWYIQSRVGENAGRWSQYNF